MDLADLVQKGERGTFAIGENFGLSIPNIHEIAGLQYISNEETLRACKALPLVNKAS